MFQVKSSIFYNVKLGVKELTFEAEANKFAHSWRGEGAREDRSTRELLRSAVSASADSRKGRNSCRGMFRGRPCGLSGAGPPFSPPRPTCLSLHLPGLLPSRRGLPARTARPAHRALRNLIVPACAAGGLAFVELLADLRTFLAFLSLSLSLAFGSVSISITQPPSGTARAVQPRGAGRDDRRESPFYSRLTFPSARTCDRCHFLT